MIPDIKNQFTPTLIIGPKSQTNNTGAGGLDARGYIGNLGFVVSIGTKTAGDNDGAISVRIVHSDDNNISNATNISGTSTVATTNNTTAVGVINIDTRLCKRYLFAIPTVTGTNSPAYPLSVTVLGQKQTQPAQ